MAVKRTRLARARKAAGYTQEALAEALDTDRSTVVRWEAGETEPLPYKRPKLAQALGVTAAGLEDLLAESLAPPAIDAIARGARQLGRVMRAISTHRAPGVDRLSERYA